MTTTTKELNYDIKIESVEDHIHQLLENQLPANIYFHNIDHTMRVKNAAIKIGKTAKLTKDELETLAFAALFHDTGFIETYENHEAQGQILAAKYLRANGYPEEKIEVVKRLIAVTKSGIAPADLLEKIICDADFNHIGQKKYRRRSDRLRKEWLENTDKKFSDLEWEKENLDFLMGHTFYTQPAMKMFGDRKQINIKKTRKRIEEAAAVYQKKLDNLSIEGNKVARTQFKTALRNHIDLTAIADQKANMMLSINALILTIGMPVFASYLSEKIFLLAPSLVFMVTCIATMVFATLSTRPIKMDGLTDLDSLNSGKTNLFFFGNFYRIKIDNYHEAIQKVMVNNEILNKSIINDLYYLGAALGDKFRYLRTCYNVFIIGMCLSLLSFVVSFLLS